MSEFDKEIETTLQEQEKPATEEKSQEEEATSEEAPKEETAKTETVVNLLGRQYDLSDINQVRELAKDYDRLGRQYAPLTQRLQELEAKLNQQQTQPLEDPETREYLKKLGFLTREELEQQREQERLEDYLSALEAEYGGSDGRPKFDRAAVLQFCVQNGIADPHSGYKLLYEKELREWELKNLKTQTPPPVVKGTTGAKIPKPKKVTLRVPESEEEIDLRSAIEETLAEASPKLSE